VFSFSKSLKLLLVSTIGYQIMLNQRTANRINHGLVKFIVLILIGMMFFSCGKTSINIDEGKYEPKIVIHGYVYPGQPVRDIQIKRNFPIGEVINKDDMHLRDAEVTITDMQTNIKYPLDFNNDSLYFELPGILFQIACEKSYRLEVRANIDGEELQASAVTKVPCQGLEIIPEYSISGKIPYRQIDESENVISPVIVYNQSPNTAFYLLSISSLDASIESFIYENPFEFDINDALEDDANLEDFMYSFRWSRPLNENSGLGILPVNWFQMWFYGRYRIVLYAGDINFYHYNRTHKNVQGPDGNLHEPIFEIDGDGIGVFGSAVTDTVYLEILKNNE